MKKVFVRIEGISPLLMHRFNGDVENIPKSKKKDQRQTRDEVEEYLYKDENGKIVQPADHIIGALKKAGAKFQIPGQGKTTYKLLMGSGAVVISPDMIEHEIQDWVIDRRPVIVNRGRIIRERPKLPKWALNFEMIYDDNEIPGHVLKEILEYAGMRVGIGDYRPSCGGPFGRFMVTNFEIQK